LSTEHIVNFNMNNLIKFIEKAGLNIIEFNYSNYKLPVNNEMLRANILEGSLPNINNIFSFSLFALNMLISPKLVFVDYKDNNNIWSYGENIRVISNR
ncbi:methyltransferase, partial [Brachyspira hyodysenteriae]